MTEDIYFRGTRCPSCGRVNDAHAGLRTSVPEEGDVSLCWGCLAPARFTATGELRALEGDELAEVLADTDIRAMRRTAARELYPEAARAAARRDLDH